MNAFNDNGQTAAPPDVLTSPTPNFIVADLDMGRLKSTFGDLGKIKRKDLADNFMKHIQSEIYDFADQTKLTLAQALNIYSPPVDDLYHPSRPADALLDVIAYHNLRTVEEDNIPSSTMAEFFDRGDTEYALGIAYLQQVFHQNVGKGIRQRDHYTYANSVDSNYADTLGRPFVQQTGDLEKTVQYLPRVRLMHIARMRKTIKGTQYEAPIVTSPENTGLQVRAEGAPLGRYKLDTSREVTYLAEIGYELEMSDRAMRSGNLTMEAVREVQMEKAEQTEDAMVNYGLQKIATSDDADSTAISGTGAKDFSAGGFTSADVIEMHLQSENQYMMTTFIGTIGALVKYLNVDVAHSSDNVKPMMPESRTLLDALLGTETIAKKSNTDVPALGTSDNMLVFDRMNTLDYIVQQRGTVQEIYREYRNRSTVIANCHSFEFRLRKDATPGQTRWLFTL